MTSNLRARPTIDIVEKSQKLGNAILSHFKEESGKIHDSHLKFYQYGYVTATCVHATIENFYLKTKVPLPLKLENFYLAQSLAQKALEACISAKREKKLTVFKEQEDRFISGYTNACLLYL